MDKLRQMFTVSYEHAVEQLERIVAKGVTMWTDEDGQAYAYWEGRRDAFQRAVDMLNWQNVAEEYDEAVKALSEEAL